MNLQTPSDNLPYALPLQELTRVDVSRVGAKAANLGELARAGILNGSQHNAEIET